MGLFKYFYVHHAASHVYVKKKKVIKIISKFLFFIAGICLIINNENFQNFSVREGSQKDEGKQLYFFSCPLSK